MTVKLNHTIVHAKDRAATAAHLADVLGLAEPTPYGPFLVVELANEVSLDVMQDAEATSQHYAFLVGEQEFDAIHARILERGGPILCVADISKMRFSAMDAEARQQLAANADELARQGAFIAEYVVVASTVVRALFTAYTWLRAAKTHPVESFATRAEALSSAGHKPDAAGEIKKRSRHPADFIRPCHRLQEAPTPESPPGR